MIWSLATPAQAAEPDAPQRVISLDYCADQYVLQLVPRDRILALSPDATTKFSYLRKNAEGLPQIRPNAEDILLQQPDLVVRLYGGGMGIRKLLNRAGIPLVQIGYANNIEDVRSVIADVSNKLGNPEEGQALITQIDRRLQTHNPAGAAKDVLYITPGGVTAGPGTLIHDLITSAGLENYAQQTGWSALPLESLVYNQPAMVAAAFFDSHSNRIGPWSATRHRIARHHLATIPVVQIQGAWSACGAWFLMDIVDALREEKIAETQ